MFGQPLSATEWNQRLQTTAGDEIAQVLEWFHTENAFTLWSGNRQELKQLNVRVSIALRQIGIPHTTAIACPRNEFIYLQKHKVGFDFWTMRDVVNLSIITNGSFISYYRCESRFCWDIQRLVGPEKMRNIYIYLLDSLIRKFRIELEKRNVPFAGDISGSMATVLCHHIACIATGKQIEKEAMSQVTSLFRSGCFIAGRIDDKDSRVLTIVGDNFEILG